MAKQLYEGRITQLARKHSKSLTPEIRDKAQIIITDLLATARDIALMNAYALSGKTAQFDDIRYRGNFEQHTDVVSAYVERAMRSGKPLEALQLLQKYKNLIGTAYFEGGIGNLPQDFGELEKAVQQLEKDATFEIKRRASHIEAVGKIHDDATYFRGSSPRGYRRGTGSRPTPTYIEDAMDQDYEPPDR